MNFTVYFCLKYTESTAEHVLSFPLFAMSVKMYEQWQRKCQTAALDSLQRLCGARCAVFAESRSKQTSKKKHKQPTDVLHPIWNATENIFSTETATYLESCSQKPVHQLQRQNEKNETSKPTKESVSTWLAAVPNVKQLLLFFFFFYVKEYLNFEKQHL